MVVLTALVIALDVSIALTVLAYGLNASARSLTRLARRPHLLLASLLAMFVVMPMLVVLAIVMVDAPDATRIALVTLALSPVPTLVAKNQLFAGPRADFAVSLTVVASAAAVVLAPTMVALVGAILDEPTGTAPGSLALRLAAFVLGPLALGIALRRWRPELARAARVPVFRVSQGALAIAAVALLVVAWDEIPAAVSVSTIALMLAFCLAGIAVAHAALRGHRDEAHVLSTVSFSRHPAIAVAVVAASFPRAEVAAVIVLYVIIAALAAAGYRAVVARRSARSDTSR